MANNKNHLAGPMQKKKEIGSDPFTHRKWVTSAS